MKENFILPLSECRTIYLDFDETPVVGKRYYLPFDGKIRSKICVGLHAILGTTEFNDPINLGRGAYYPTNSDNVKCMTITLVNIRDKVVAMDVPLYTFTLPGKKGNLRNIARNIDPSKSYIRVLTDEVMTSQTTVPLCFYLKTPTCKPAEKPRPRVIHKPIIKVKTVANGICK